jgi:signal transduction histidine kinase
VAASIAHEIRQPLASIVATADAGALLLARKPPEITEIPEIFDAIAEQGVRTGQIIDSIRAMFGHRAADRSPLDVNALLLETIQLLSREMNESNTTAQHHLAETLPAVNADRQQLQLVFLNLFVNALEAMVRVDDRPRILTVRTSAPEDDTVLISVQDTGVGLNDAEAERIFDTFFTTKPQGTGMGLPLCRAVVEAHGGRLWAEKSTPQGATFHVQLPSFR